MVPLIGWFAAIIVFFVLMQQWTEADWIEIIIIVFFRWILMMVIAIPFGLGLMMGFRL